MTLPAILKSRTVWFAIALAVLSVIQGYIAMLPISPVNQMLIGIIISIAIVILRAITTQPLADK